MLRLVKLSLSNPAIADGPVINVTAVVTGDDFGICLGPHLVEQLRLEKVDQREAREIGARAPRLLPYFGPLRVTARGKDVFTGAIQTATGAAVGRALIEELGLEDPEPTDAGQARFILIREGCVSEEICREVAAYAEAQAAQALPSQIAVPGQGRSYLNTEVRDSEVIPPGPIDERLNEIAYGVFTSHVEPFFGVDIEWWEKPQVLRYGPGGKYEIHADADRWAKKPGGQGRWERHLDRDVSILVYLNDDFTGGKLRFPAQDLTIQPKPGMLVAFPSNGLYRHAAERTESGVRMVMVSWAGVVGRERCGDRPKNGVLKDAWRRSR